MKESLIVYVEGIPASGKTTTLNRLAKEFPDRIAVIPEYVNSEEMNNDQGWFMKNDEMKLQKARESGKEITFVDRGHLSTVIYSLAEVKIRDTKNVSNVFDWYFETILPNKQLPDYYVLLLTDPTLSLQRRAHLLTPDNMWDYPEALTLANRTYLEYMNAYEASIPRLTIVTQPLTLDQLAQKFITQFKL